MSCQKRAQLSLMWLYPNFRSVVVDILKQECWWHQSALRRVELSWFYQLLSHDRWIGLSEGKRDVPPCHLKRKRAIHSGVSLGAVRQEARFNVIDHSLSNGLRPVDSSWFTSGLIYQCCILKQAYLEVRDLNDASLRSHLATAYNTLSALTATPKM